MKPQRLTYIAVIPLLQLLSACGEAEGPCVDSSCVPRPDLLIPELAVVASEHDPSTGLGVVDGNRVTVEYTVRNQGNVASPQATLVLRFGWNPTHGTQDSTLASWAADTTLLLPPIAAGGTLHRSASFRAWDTPDNPRSATTDDDKNFAVAQLLLADAEPNNDRTMSAPVHVRVALLEMQMSVQDTAVQVGRPFSAHLAIRNTSRHGTLPASSVGFWLCDAGYNHCDNEADMGFGTHDIPAIPPGGRYEQDLTLTVPAGAALQDKTAPYYSIIHLTAPGTGDSLLWLKHAWLQGRGPDLMVHPDYSDCQPALLVSNQSVVAPLACRFPRPFALFALAVRSDREYAIEQAEDPGAEVYRRNGGRLMTIYPGSWYRFAPGDTLFIADYVSTSYARTHATRTMVLRERPIN